MDNHYEELMHFVGNNVGEVICRNWANDIRRMERAERHRAQLREDLEKIDADLEGRNFLENSSLRDTARAALKATEGGVMDRRNLGQRLVAAKAAMEMDIYRDQLRSVQNEPSSDWMDQMCKKYSLRHLLRFTITNDRAHRKYKAWP